jgi:hypothetical protein
MWPWTTYPVMTCARAKAPNALMMTTTSGGARQSEENKTDERYSEIPWCRDRTCPDRVVEGRAEQTDHRRVDARAS